MKITEKLQKAEKEGRPFWSFEFFPPRTAQVSYNCFARWHFVRLGNVRPASSES